MKTFEEVADELNKLADQKEFHGLRVLLRRLARDLPTRDAAKWARVDLLAVFEADLDMTGLATAARTLSGLRSVLILLPVLITWSGIFSAVDAYRDLLRHASPGERSELGGASFLQLWTTGFEGRTWVTLDIVALGDALAIIAVIVVAYLAYISGAAALRAEDRERAKLREALVDAKLALTAEGYDAPDQLSQRMIDLVPAYRTTLQTLLTAQNELAAAVDDGRRNVEAMVGATKDLAGAGTEVANGAAEVGRQVVALEEKVRDLETQMTTLSSGVLGLGTQVPEINRGLRGVLSEVQDVGNRLVTVHRKQDKVVEKLSAIANNPLIAAESAKRVADQALEAEEQMRAAVAALPEQMQHVGERVVAAVDRELDERRASTSRARPRRTGRGGLRQAGQRRRPRAHPGAAVALVEPLPAA